MFIPTHRFHHHRFMTTPTLQHRHKHLNQVITGTGLPTHRHSVMHNGMNYLASPTSNSPVPALLGLLGPLAFAIISQIIRERPITFQDAADAEQQWDEGLVEARNALNAMIDKREGARQAAHEALAKMQQAETYLAAL